jgi:hypothetical protein
MFFQQVNALWSTVGEKFFSCLMWLGEIDHMPSVGNATACLINNFIFGQNLQADLSIKSKVNYPQDCCACAARCKMKSKKDAGNK